MPPSFEQTPPENPQEETENPDLVSAQARVGLRLFLVYSLIYAGFIGLNAFAPRAMAWTPFGGLNVAILYGMGLIASAFVLALIYMALCRRIAGQYPAGG
ncbi:hypothetical protein BH23PLA1_BH23PLA1_41760 [soil metagenome]